MKHIKLIPFVLTGVSGLFSLSAAERPNIVFVFADQWRGQDVGYMGNNDVITPNIDRLAQENFVATQMVSNCPVSCPYRAILLTGTYPDVNGCFYNDKPLRKDLPTLAQQLKKAGYATAYIGKWHLDGHGRGTYIPKERRGGFDYWKARECNHNYNHSFYYGDSPDTLYWEGYDAIAQTRDAIEYIKNHDNKTPFFLMLSWGPPHDPYHTAPKQYRKLYENFANIDKNTIFVFTSDHGDMLLSHGQIKKTETLG